MLLALVIPAVPVIAGVLWVILRSLDPGPGRRLALQVAIAAVVAYGVLVYLLVNSATD